MAPRRSLPEGLTTPGAGGVRLRTLTGVAALGLAAVVALQTWWLLTPGPAVRDAAVVIDLPPQRGFREIVARLGEAKVIQSPVAFALLAAARGSIRSLKSGEYQIPKGATSLAVLRQL